METKFYKLPDGASVSFAETVDGKEKVVTANIKAHRPNSDGKDTVASHEIVRIRANGERVERPALERVRAAYEQHTRPVGRPSRAPPPAAAPPADTPAPAADDQSGAQ